MRYTKRAHLASLFDREKNEYLTIQEKSLLHNITFYTHFIYRNKHTYSNNFSEVLFKHME